jgi:hypothetical protein
MIIPEKFGFNYPSGLREEAFWNMFPIESNVKLSPAVAAILNFISEQKNLTFVEDHPMNIHVQFALIIFVVSEKKAFEHFPIGSNVNICPAVAAILDFRSTYKTETW